MSIPCVSGISPSRYEEQGRMDETESEWIHQGRPFGQQDAEGEEMGPPVFFLLRSLGSGKYVGLLKGFCGYHSLSSGITPEKT